MPCYDSVRVGTLVSLLDTFSTLGQSGIEATFKSVRSSLVTHARNLLTCGFINSNFDYMLCIDADIEFQHEAVLRMLVPEEPIVCTPYRIKDEGIKYTAEFKDPNVIKILPWDMVEIETAGAGLMLIHRRVFKKLMNKHPELKINFDEPTRKKMNEEIGTSNDAVNKYMYNFWDTSFSLKTGEWKGEDLAFCKLVTDAGFKIYANLDSWTTHHGTWGWKGRFGDTLLKKENNE